MRIIGIETSGAYGSAALGDDGAVIAEQPLGGSREHGRTLVPALGKLLQKAGWSREQLSAVAVSVGPGSFTGVRIGVSAARALAYAAGLPIYPVCSLAAVAQNGVGGGERLVCPMISAFSGLLYAAAWRVGAEGETTPVLAPFAADLEAILEQIAQARSAGEPLFALGSGAVRHAERLAEAGFDVGGEAIACGTAASVVTLAERAAWQDDPGVPWAELVPRYVRTPTFRPLEGADPE